MTPVITAAMSKLIKVVGSLSLTFMPSPFSTFVSLKASRDFAPTCRCPARRRGEGRRKEREGEGEGRGGRGGEKGKKQSFRPLDSVWRFPFKRLYVPPRSRFMIASGREKEIAELGFLKVKFLPSIEMDSAERTLLKLDKGFVELIRWNVRGTFFLT